MCFQKVKHLSNSPLTQWGRVQAVITLTSKVLQASLWHHMLLSLSESVMFICLPYQWPAWTDLFIITYLVHTRLLSDSSFSLVLSYSLKFLSACWLCFHRWVHKHLKHAVSLQARPKPDPVPDRNDSAVAIKKGKKNRKQSFSIVHFSWGNLLQ